MIITRTAKRPASSLLTSTPNLFSRTALIGLLSCSLLAAGAVGCSKGADDKVSVAQVAVRANPDLELMATDAEQAVLTVRVRNTGQVLTVKADDVIAGTAFRDLVTTAAPAAAAAEAAPSGSRVEINTPGARVSVGGGSADGKAAPSLVVESKSGGSAAVGAAPSGTATGQAEDARERLREAGRALGSTLPADAPAPSARREEAPVARREEQAPPARREEATLRRRNTPVLCSGRDSVVLDRVLLEVDTVAVSASGKCRVTITNSHVIGRIGGVMVAGDATVMIEGSQVEAPMALQVAGDGEVSVRGSRIEGRVQTSKKAAVRDLGENVWR